MVAACGYAQVFSDGYSFVLPPADTSASPFLPPFPSRPLGPEDFVTVTPDGHFAVSGTPIRFFGTNATADGAFPQKTEAWFIAGRLRKMGYNLVRLHHMDNSWTSSGSLFGSMPDTRHLNPSVLDRLDAFLAELKNNRIYANVNLHVSRVFRQSDGVPDADSLRDFGKGYTYFDPILISLQKEYARQLLTHLNPYSGLALVDDPVMAMVEITNENSLYRLWRDDALKPYAVGGALPVRLQHILDSLWGAYLQELYPSDSALAVGWNTGSTGEGVESVINGSFESEPFPAGWTLEQHAPASASVSRASVNVHGGMYAANVIVKNTSGTDWHVQWKQIGLSIEKDRSYTLRFAARADSIRRVGVNIMEDGAPYTWYAGTNVALDTIWQEYTFLFTAPDSRTGTVRLAFAIGASGGSYWFDDVSMKTSARLGLLAGEHLPSPPRRLDFGECGMFTDGRVQDQTAFYIKIQTDFFDGMKKFLRDTLGVRVPIVGTNWNFGPPDLSAQSGLDYIDNHAYWDHPTFPGIPWSATDWTITNQPMVRNVDGGTIGRLMNGIGQTGKPYTISEYNHAFPNIYQAEGPLFLSAYASFHGVDGLTFFDYNSSTDWQSDFVSGYFAMHRNTALMALMPSLGHAYRSGLISPALQTVELDLSNDDIQLAPRAASGGWQGASLVPLSLPLLHAVRTRTLGSPSSNLSNVPSPGSPPYVSDTGELRWDPAGVFSVSAPSFASVTGFPENLVGVPAGPLTVMSASDHATISWVSLGENPLDRNGRTLLTVVSRVQNAGMVWDGTTTVHDRWGGPPTTLKPLVLSLRIHIHADSLHLFPLNVLGTESGPPRTLFPTDTSTFLVTLDQSVERTPWFGLEAFGKGTLTVQRPETPLTFRLQQNYPNPFNPTTTIRYAIPAVGTYAHTSLRVYDLLGREVAVLVNEKRAPGRYQAEFNAAGLASGVYLYKLTAGGFVETKKMVLVR